MNSATNNILINVFGRHYIHIFVGYLYLRLELFGHRIYVCSNLGTDRKLSKVVVTIYVPTNNVWEL